MESKLFTNIFFWGILLVVLFGNLYFPFAICLASFTFVLIKRKNLFKQEHYICLWVITLFSATIGLVNSFKVPENDLIWYLHSYALSSSLNLKDYVEIGADAIFRPTWKDPFFSTVVWTLNRIFNGNETLFKFTISFINYILLTTSFYLYWKQTQKRTLSMLMCGIVFSCFFPLLFTMSLHLLRQFMSSCLMIPALILACFYPNNKIKIILIALMMILTHSTAFFFLPFLFIPGLGESFSKKKSVYILIFSLFALIQTVSLFLLKSFSILPTSVQYALYRAAEDTTYDLGDMPASKILLVCISLLLSIYIGHISPLEKNKGCVRFCNTVIILCLFILFSLSQSELSNRMFFYLPFFHPFLIAMLCQIKRNTKKIYIAICSILICYFPIFLTQGTWTYSLPSKSIWTLSIFDLFF